MTLGLCLRLAAEMVVCWSCYCLPALLLFLMPRCHVAWRNKNANNSSSFTEVIDSVNSDRFLFCRDFAGDEKIFGEV